MSLEFDVGAYVRKLATAHRNVKEMWLLGSRANGTAKPTSDWDILAFADEPTFNALRDDTELQHSDVVPARSISFTRRSIFAIRRGMLALMAAKAVLVLARS